LLVLAIALARLSPFAQKQLVASGKPLQYQRSHFLRCQECKLLSLLAIFGFFFV
jgi:hypothetical protein